MMKLKQLESLLEDLDGFESPKITLEQYVTPSYVAARIIHTISVDGYIEGKTICDLGTGPGILAIGSALMGGNHVVGVDIDQDAIAIAQGNLESMDFDETGVSVDFVQANLTKQPFKEKSFDVAIMNPPFGTKGNSGIDATFLKVAIKLSNEAVYSLHKSATREYILKMGQQLGVKSEVLGQFSYDLPATYARHVHLKKAIDVDLFRFTHRG